MSSSKITKQTKSKSKSTVRNVNLLSAILECPIEMPPCSACERRGEQSCEVSPLDSSRCSECVKRKLAHCDVQGVTPAQLRHITTQHQKLESDLEKAEEEHLQASLKIQRLRKQKRLWMEKMVRAVSRGITSVEELEKVEKEEAEREATRQAEAEASNVPVGRSSTDGLVNSTFEQDWDECMGHLPVEPELAADFNVAIENFLSESVGASHDSSRGSQ